MARGTVRADSGRQSYGTGRPVCGRKHCKECRRWRHLIDFNVERRTARGIAVAYSNTCKACLRIRERERKKDPVAREAYRRRQRAHKAAKRRAMGAPIVGPRVRHDVVATGYGETVDASLIITFMEDFIRRHDLEHGVETPEEARAFQGPRGWVLVAAKTGVDARSLYRIRHSGRAHLNTVDRILIGLDGPPLELVYPFRGG